VAYEDFLSTQTNRQMKQWQNYIFKNLYLKYPQIYNLFVVVCRSGPYDVEVVVLQIFAMVHIKGMWNLGFGTGQKICPIYGL